MEFWEGFWSGIVVWLLLAWLLRSLTRSLILKIAAEEIEKIEKDQQEILLTVEQHQSVLYCYRKDNDEFVGQGKTVDELLAAFKKKYPNRSGRILKEDDAELL
jgi:hypothetical protein